MTALASQASAGCLRDLSNTFLATARISVNQLSNPVEGWHRDNKNHRENAQKYYIDGKNSPVQWRFSGQSLRCDIGSIQASVPGYPVAVGIPFLRGATPVHSRQTLTKTALTIATVWAIAPSTVYATEGALGRQVTGTTVQPNIGIVSPEPILAVNLSQIYLDGKIGGSREAPIAGTTSLGLDGKVAFTLATVMKVWDTGPGQWNYASSITVPYIWTKVDATLTGPRGRNGTTSDTASNLFDLYFTPIIAGYHFSATQHMALSLNIWAPTGKYDANALANPSLNNWTFIPQIAYTGIFPESGMQLDAATSVQFYTRNSATDYRNAPIFGLDLMARKMFKNGVGAGVVVGTQQQLGSDKGPTADTLNGFKGHDWSAGPIVTYDRKLANNRSMSLGIRWVPTVSSTRRLDSSSTVMASATLIF